MPRPRHALHQQHCPGGLVCFGLEVHLLSEQEEALDDMEPAAATGLDKAMSRANFGARTMAHLVVALGAERLHVLHA